MFVSASLLSSTGVWIYWLLLLFSYLTAWPFRSPDCLVLSDIIWAAAWLRDIFLGCCIMYFYGMAISSGSFLEQAFRQNRHFGTYNSSPFVKCVVVASVLVSSNFILCPVWELCCTNPTQLIPFVHSEVFISPFGDSFVPPTNDLLQQCKVSYKVSGMWIEIGHIWVAQQKSHWKRNKHIRLVKKGDNTSELM